MLTFAEQAELQSLWPKVVPSHIPLGDRPWTDRLRERGEWWAEAVRRDAAVVDASNRAMALFGRMVEANPREAMAFLRRMVMEADVPDTHRME